MKVQELFVGSIFMEVSVLKVSMINGNRATGAHLPNVDNVRETTHGEVLLN